MTKEEFFEKTKSLKAENLIFLDGYLTGLSSPTPQSLPTPVKPPTAKYKQQEITALVQPPKPRKNYDPEISLKRLESLIYTKGV